MRILDENNIEIVSPDYTRGYTIPDAVLVKHHEAIKEVKEQGHYEVIREYPNGGKDLRWIADVPKVEGKAAWDEYEEILRYKLYTEEQLAEMEAIKNKPTDAQRITDLEEALEMILSGVTE